MARQDSPTEPAAVPVRSFTSGLSPLRQATVSGSGRLALTYGIRGRLGRLTIWDVETQHERYRIETEWTPWQVRFSLDETGILGVLRDTAGYRTSGQPFAAEIVHWPIDELIKSGESLYGEKEGRVLYREEDVTGVAMSRDSQTVAFHGDTHLTILDVGTERIERLAAPSRISRIAVSRRGTLLAVEINGRIKAYEHNRSSTKGAGNLIDTVDFGDVQSFDCSDETIAAASPTSVRLVYGADAGEIIAGDETLVRVAINGSGSALAVAYESRIELVDPRNRDVIKRLVTSQAKRLTFSFDDKFLISVHADNVARLWDLPVDRVKPVDTNSSQEHLRLAERRWGEGKLDEALAEARLAAVFGAGSSETQLLLARVLLEKGQLDEALALARQAVALDSGSSEARLLLAKVLLDRGQPAEVLDEALDQAREAARLDSGSSEARLLQAKVLRDQGRLAEALAQAREAAHLDSGSSEARRLLDELLNPKAQLTCDSWTIDDKLGYKNHASAVAEFICHRDTKPPLTIGVKGPWGSGKTSLMRMIQEQLDPLDDGQRQQIPLEAESRKKVLPRRFRLPRHGEQEKAEPPPVQNREVVSEASRPTALDSGAAGSSLQIDASSVKVAPGRRWRPTVWFNPWMYQSSEQIWAGFAYEIIHQVTDRLPPGDRERFWLRLNLARLDREAVRTRAYRLVLERLVPMAIGYIAVAIIALVVFFLARLWPHLATSLHRTGVALFSLGSVAVVVGAVGRSIQFRHGSASVTFGDLVSEPAVLGRVIPEQSAALFTNTVLDPGYQTQVGLLQLVQTDMRRVLELVASEDRPLVVFVDDLDRCSPGAVVQVIEAINLFLAGEFRNCIFVLAMEPDVVAASVEVAYKDLKDLLRDRPSTRSWDTLGWRFLEKIVQLPLSLPPVDDEQRIEEFVRSLLNVPVEQLPPGKVKSGDGLPTTRESPYQQRESLTLPDREQVQKISEKMFSLHPTRETLDQIAYQVQGDGSNVLDEATRTARDLVFGELYSDSEAFEAIQDRLRELDFNNPREIKRYINLFRFYTFRANLGRKEGDKKGVPTGDQIAKLAALTIRWPDLLDLLTQAADDKKSNLRRLTEAASANETWKEELERLNVAPDDSDNYDARERWDHLRAFLRSDPDISATAWLV